MPMPDQFVAVISKHADLPVSVRVERGGERLQLTLVPRPAETEAGRIGRIGVQLGVETKFIDVRYGPVESLWRGVERTGEVAWFSLRMLGRLVTGGASWRNLMAPLITVGYPGRTARTGCSADSAWLVELGVRGGKLAALTGHVPRGDLVPSYPVLIVRGRAGPDRWSASRR